MASRVGLPAEPGSPPIALRRSGSVFRLLLIGGVVGVLALVPTLAGALADPFLVRLGIRVVVFALAAVALNLVLGFGGLVSLMHAGLFGIGAYTVAILAHHEFEGSALLGLLPGTSNLLVSLPLAMLASGFAALGTGVVALRTSGTYFIMITLAFNQMLYYVFVALQQYGGEDGLQILVTLTLPGLDLGQRTQVFYLALGLLALTLVGLDRLVHSRFGVVLRAAAQNERRTVALGIPPLPYKLAAFGISGALAGAAGALLAVSQSFVSPADLSWVKSGDLVVMCVLGGMTVVWGPVAGAALFLLAEFFLASWMVYWQLPFGIMIIGIVVFLQGGLTGIGRGAFGAGRAFRG